MSSSRNHRRKRSTHRSKSVATTEEIWMGKVLKGGFVVFAIMAAAWLTLRMSRL